MDEEKVIQPAEIPAGAKFNGHRDYDVQELKIERYNIRFRLAELNQVLLSIKLRCRPFLTMPTAQTSLSDSNEEEPMKARQDGSISLLQLDDLASIISNGGDPTAYLAHRQSLQFLYSVWLLYSTRVN